MKPTAIKNILVTGKGGLAAGIATDLIKGNITVKFFSGDISNDKEIIEGYIADCKNYGSIVPDTDRLHYLSAVTEAGDVEMVICITDEDIAEKQKLIRQLDGLMPASAIIAMNTESFLLEELNIHTIHPQRVIGLNWCHPAYTTGFLEIIADEHTPDIIISAVENAAVNGWQKDPCIVRCGYSVNARLMAALAREAFYLVENGYASVEDIDRACRNDAGYYLPFAGNCRYMDLMGTYAYGLVMKDLNRELSKQTRPPLFFGELLNAGKTGMNTGKGFYHYSDQEVKALEEKYRRFSFEIKAIIDRYPFNDIEASPKKLESKITLDE